MQWQKRKKTKSKDKLQYTKRNMKDTKYCAKKHENDKNRG